MLPVIVEGFWLLGWEIGGSLQALLYIGRLLTVYNEVVNVQVFARNSMLAEI